ncbi:putative late blight resistance protein -like protein R1B-17-like, partial [Capsicum annuum]
MEKQGEIEIGKTNYFEVSFSALRKDVVNVLDFMERLKNEKDQNVVNVYLIERLMRLELAFICTYVQLSYSDLDQFEDKSDCFKSRGAVELPPPESPSYIQVFSSQYEILQNVSGNMKDFHGLIVIGCIEHDIVQYVSPQFQLIAERVALFLWDVRIDGDSRLFKLPHLLMKIIPVELEVMHICFTNLKASPSAEVGRFSKQLLETSPEVLREYLIHLQEHVVTVITASTSGPRNIHVMIEFLLIILTDLPKEIIHHDKLFDLLARAAALIRE